MTNTEIIMLLLLFVILWVANAAPMIANIFHIRSENKKRRREIEMEMEEVECNMCGSLMCYDEENGIYVCTNSECTRCN